MHVGLTALLASVVVATAACGSNGAASSTAAGASSSTGTSPSSAASATTPSSSSSALDVRDDDPTKYLRESSVGEGIGPAPAISTPVEVAAKAASCTVKAYPSTTRDHADTPARSPAEGVPPTSGEHFPVWADWGVYDRALPAGLVVHNLEHGGVAVYLGSDVADDVRQAVVDLWASSPPYVLVVDAAAADEVPAAGLVVTSWQRALRCDQATSGPTIEAVREFRNAYRGAGPEAVPSLDANATGLPTPLYSEPSAAATAA